MMKIQRLYIRDFGILRNQTLEELDPGLVVIGGLNRAGKSTLMQVLRYLGYGFPKDGNLPPAKDRYEAEADIRLNAGDVYNLRLNGHGEPVLKRINGTKTDITSPKDLYALDSFSYGRLFTITLDELAVNRAISGDDRMRLQSILLGAGLREMLLLPQLEQTFYREGDRIGGKRGNPGVRQFRPYLNIIEAGRKLKQKGLSQVQEYQEKQQELKDMEEVAEALKKDVEELNNLVVQLDVIKNGYDGYLRLLELRTWLADKKDWEWEEGPTENQLERIRALWDNYTGVFRKLREKELQSGISPEQEEQLLAASEEMTNLLAEVSGLQERIRSLRQRQQELDRKRRDLILKVKEANAHWDENHIDYITCIKADNVEHNRLIELVNEYRELEYKCKNQADILQRTREEFLALEGRAVEFKDSRPWLGVRKYFYFSLAFTFLGVLLSLLNPLSGIIVGVGGIVGSALFFIMKALGSGASRRAAQEQEKELNTREARVRAEEGVLDHLESNLKSIGETLNAYKDKLGLPRGVPQSVLPDHLMRIKDIQRGAAELDWLSDELEDIKGFVREQYNRYRKFLAQFQGRNTGDADHGVDPYGDEDWNRIIQALRLWGGRLRDAEELKLLRREIGAIRKEITDIMEEYESADSPWDRGYYHGDNSNGFNRRVSAFMERAQNGIEYARNKEALRESIQGILGSMSSDGIRRAFIPDSADRTYLLNAFMEKCREYTSAEEAEREYSQKIRERDTRLEDLEETRESIRTLEDDLERLGAIENLTQGQRQIDSGRAELKALADQYALNMTSAFLLREAEKNLLEGMKDGVMKSAGNIFNRMTKGDYQGILPSEPLLESDFQAVLDEDSDPQTIGMLSRGTQEQLYLAVRLSRIMDIEPCLPIIIDDSFANFDSLHLHQSIDILSELANTHQIFILTCHGELVEKIAEARHRAQYWLLEQGRIRASDCDSLSSHLRSF
jgi:DNA repair exonuclease SbcCD ATPase subunit